MEKNKKQRKLKNRKRKGYSRRMEVVLMTGLFVLGLCAWHPLAGRMSLARETAGEGSESFSSDEGDAETEEMQFAAPETEEGQEVKKADCKEEDGETGDGTENAEKEKKGEEEEKEKDEGEEIEAEDKNQNPEKEEGAAKDTEREMENPENPQDPVQTPQRALEMVMPRTSSMTAAGQSSVYSYTGGMQSFVVKAGGLYRIECRGGKGGDAGLEGYTGGKGGSVSGVLRLKKGQILYIAAGGAGTDGDRHSSGSGELNSAAYNGGGRGGWDESALGNHGRWRNYGSGGGATDVRLDGEGVENQIMVAGGGGAAAGVQRSDGGNAGGGSYNGRRLNGDNGDSGGGKGGGGGGYMGGTAGNGGSSYVDPERFSEVSFRSDANSGYGYAVITVVSLAPEFYIVRSPEGPTNSDVTLRVEIKDEGQGLEAESICWREEGRPDLWTESRERTVAENGTYYCRVRDRQGNMTEEAVTVDYIDKLSPKLKLAPDTSEWTKEEVILTAEGEDCAENSSYSCSGLSSEPFLWGGKTAGSEGGRISDWTAESVLHVKENGTYSCRIRDLAGNESEAEYRVKNIDITPPQVTIRREGKWHEGSLKIFFDAQDRQPDGSPGCGLHRQAYSFDGHEFSESNMQIIDREGTYGIWVRDKLGNVSQVRFPLYYDRKEDGGEKKKTGSGSGNKPVEGSKINQETPAADGEEKAGEGITDTEEVGGEEQKTESRTEAPQMEQEKNVRHTVHMEQKDSKKLQRVQVMRKPAATQLRKETSGMPQRILYSLWLAAVLGGLLWILVSLVFENVIVYRKDEKGKYRRAGRCAIIRKQEYRQINLTTCLKGDDKDCKVRFTRLFVWMNARKKVLIRTYHGIELRNIAKEIEIRSGV